MKQINYSLMLLLILPLQLLAQQVKISGKVTDVTDGRQLVGVSVWIKGSEGRQAVQQSINGRRTINISMSADETELSTVVVTALGTTVDLSNLIKL